MRNKIKPQPPQKRMFGIKRNCCPATVSPSLNSQSAQSDSSSNVKNKSNSNNNKGRERGRKKYKIIKYFVLRVKLPKIKIKAKVTSEVEPNKSTF